MAWTHNQQPPCRALTCPPVGGVAWYAPTVWRALCLARQVCIIRPSDDVELLARWHLKRRLRPSNLSGALHLMTLGEAYAERALVERLLAVQHGGSLAAAVAEAEPDAISVASAGVAAAGAAAALASVRLQQQQEAAVTARFAVSTPLSRQVLLIPTSRPRKMAVV